jgi:hypothetical protein
MDGQTPAPFKEQSVSTLNKNFAKKKIKTVPRLRGVNGGNYNNHAPFYFSYE